LSGAIILFRAIDTQAEPDADALGKRAGYPRGTPATMYSEPHKVGSFSAVEQILKTRKVPRGDDVATFEHGEPADITYRFEGAKHTLDDYLDRRRVTGLVVLKDGKIVAERYRYGRTEHDKFISFSVAKSVNSLLVGIAVEKGLIRSLDDTAETYVPELKGSGYGAATVRNLLRMSSGVKFVENYDGKDDIARLGKASNGLSGESALEVLASFNEQLFPGGEKAGYSSAETMVLGYVVARAAKENLATLTSRWLWRPIGAESDAAWIVGVDGQEQAMGGFNAVLRDYARLGRLMADDGRVGSQQVVPLEYLLDATDIARQSEHFKPLKATPYFGYGYQFWLLPMRERTFAMLGIFGQAVYVQPKSKIVMVHMSVNATPKDPEPNIERDALWRGVLTTLCGDLQP
jgi:CubicO group peptidase (beta-lactamase class C family)